MYSGEGCGLGPGEGLQRAALVWVISHWQPAALWSLLPSQEHASHICQSSSPPPTSFSAESQHCGLTMRIVTCSQDALTRRVRPTLARRRWWQILAELVSICESWRGESSASHKWICRVCSGPVWWPWLWDGLMERRSVIPKLWGARWGTLQQGGQVNQCGLTGSEPLNDDSRPVLRTDPIFSVYISVLPAPPFCPHNGISFSDTNLKSSFNSAGWVSIPWLFPQGMSRGLSYIIRFLSPTLKMGVIRN